jgi:hypothetical protein
VVGGGQDLAEFGAGDGAADGQVHVGGELICPELSGQRIMG